jgi:hypothetical protein
MLADRERVMMVVVRQIQSIHYLFARVVEFAAGIHLNFIPAFVVKGSLEGANHTLNYFFGHLAVTRELASLTFREAASNEDTMGVTLRQFGIFNFVYESLAAFGCKIGCIVDSNSIIIHGQSFKESLL